MGRVSWLHVSDFHFQAGNSYDRDTVLGALVTSVRRFREDDGRKPDLIFATGDVGQFGAAAEYDGAGAFFDALLAAAAVPKNRLFVVPGNHDVARGPGEDLLRTLDTAERAGTYFSRRSPLPHIRDKQAAFQQWFDTYFTGIRQFPVTSSCGPVEMVSVNGTKVGILPLNSALFAQGDDDHGKLWLGHAALKTAVAALKDQGADLNIALMHHPLEWLHDAETAKIRVTLEGAVDILLRGHLHQSDVQSCSGLAGTILHLAAGASYQAPKYPRRALYGEITDRTATVFPIRYESDPHETWTLDTSLFPDKKDYLGTFKLTGKGGRPANPGQSGAWQEPVLTSRPSANHSFTANGVESPSADTEKRLEKLRRDIVGKLEASKTAIEALEAKTGLSAPKTDIAARAATVVDRLMATKFETAVEWLRDVHETVSGQADRRDVRAIVAVSERLIPWLYVVSATINLKEWEPRDLGRVIGIPCGLRSFTEVIMAGINHRHTAYRKISDPDGWPQPKHMVEVVPEAGRDARSQTLAKVREDLFNRIKIPLETKSKEDNEKDEAIRKRLEYYRMENKIRVYWAYQPSSYEPLRTEQDAIMTEIAQHYKPLAILRLDGDAVQDQERFDVIRRLLDFVDEDPKT